MEVGAEPHHILTQFLVEALSPSIAGGLIGVAGGVGTATWLARRFQ
jgi:ABC-type lipoprotein release transport system permease subunit